MGLEIALIDKSEIIKKMLSHSLHYFGANVHRFETLEDFPQEAAFDLVFIDWDMKIGERPLALMARAQIQQTPIVILHQNSDDSQLKQFPHIKKPIDANLIRELTAQLVPKMNQLKVHKFLKYPVTAPFKKELSELQSEVQKKPALESLDLPELSPDEMDAIQPKAEGFPLESSSPPFSEGEGEKAAGESDLDLPELSEEEKEAIQFKAEGFTSSPFSEGEEEKASSESVSGISEERPNVIQSSSTLDDHSPPVKVDKEAVHKEMKKSTETGDLPKDISEEKEMAEKLPEPSVDSEVKFEHTFPEGLQLDSKKNGTDFQYHKEAQLTDSSATLKEEDSSPKDSSTVSISKVNVLEKDNLNLDENTQNDLGPAALVNTDQNSSNEDINKITLDKYKKSSGFKDLIQNIIKESGHQVLRESIVQHNRSFIEQILKEYSQTLEFEKVLSDVLKEHGQEKIQNLIATDSKNIIEKSITAYIESSHFKNLVESTLKSMIQENFKNQMKDSFGDILKKEILLTAKQVIEAEIKTLLDGAEDL